MDVEIVNATSEVCNIKIDLNSLMDSCRVCMTQSLHMSCIFNSDKVNIIDEIHFCTGVRLKQEEGLPSQICDLCLNNLSVAYKFKTSCLLANETFHKLILNSAIKAEEPELSDIEYEEIIECKDETVEEFEDDKGDEKQVKRELQVPVHENRESKSKVKKETESSPVKGRPKKSTTLKQTPRRLKKYKFKKLCCEPCNLKFESKKESDEHKKEIHKDSETWVCEICGKMFIHRASHYTHVKSHQPPKYSCDQCDYKTWHKYDLVKHIRIHTGLKMYQCEYCTCSYYTSSNLTSHIRRHHMHERQHHCHLCRRTFFDKTKLNRHLDSHLEIKRFTCDICHSCFTRRCYWKKHLLRVHNIITPPQRPGRQKINLVIGEYLVNGKQEEVGDFYAKEGLLNKKI